MGAFERPMKWFSSLLLLKNKWNNIDHLDAFKRINNMGSLCAFKQNNISSLIHPKDINSLMLLKE